MNTIQEALRQVLEGEDFEAGLAVVKSVKAEVAVKRLPGLPYSIATNVAHTDIWNRLWLAKLEGKPRFKPFPDFPVVSKEDWPAVRGAFVQNLSRAYEIACAEPFVHSCDDDDAAHKTLLKIGVHSAYHIGQIVLLKRALRGQKGP